MKTIASVLFGIILGVLTTSLSFVPAYFIFPMLEELVLVKYGLYILGTVVIFLFLLLHYLWYKLNFNKITRIICALLSFIILVVAIVSSLKS